MSTYMESVRAQSEALVADKIAEHNKTQEQATAEWTKRLTPLEDRLSKLLSNLPQETLAQGLSLDALRRLLSGKWRGNCHPGELGAALRKLGFSRHRSWSETQGGFKALWHHSQSIEKVK